MDRPSEDSASFATQAERLRYLAEYIDWWQRNGLLDASSAAGLRRSIAPQPVVVEEDLPEEPILIPPAVLRPPFRWRNIAESLLAERTLNTLLALGAFLILVSALVISVFNPTRLALLPHLGVLAGTMALFYAAGWFCYRRLRLTRAGEGLLGIGATFVPLVVWSLGGANGLAWSTNRIWLVGSIAALVVHAASHLVLPGRVFAWLVAIAVGSTLMALLTEVGVGLDWTLFAVVPLAVGYTLLASHAPIRRRLRQALFVTAQVVTPLVLLVLLGAKLAPIRTPSISDYAVGGAWWLGVGLYALCAYQRRRGPFEAICAWLVPVAYLLTLAKTPLEPAWYGVCFIALAAAYGLVGARFGHLGRTSPIGHVAVGLTLLGPLWAAFGGLGWALVGAFVADALVYATVVYARRVARLAYLPVALLVGAFLLALRLLSLPGWTLDHILPWLALTAGLGLGAEASVRASGEHRRPLRDVLSARGAWRAAFAPALFTAAYLAAVVTVGVTLFRVVERDRGLAGLTLALIAAGLAASSWSRRSSLFLYPASVLTPIAVGLLVVDIATEQQEVLIGLTLALLAVAYGWVGRRLEMLAGAAYRLPLWIAGLALSVIGPSLAVWGGTTPQPALIAAACTLVFVVAVAATRSPAWAYPACLWALVTYELALRVAFPDASLGLRLAALVVPTCLAVVGAEILASAPAAARRMGAAAAAGSASHTFALIRLARARWALPLLIAAACSFVLSLAGTTDALTGLVLSAVYAIAFAVVAMRHGTAAGERWVSVAFLAVAGVLALAYLDVPFGRQQPFYMLAALVLVSAGALTRYRTDARLQAWHRPLTWSALGIAGLTEWLLVQPLLRGDLRTASVTTALGAGVLLTLAYSRRSTRVAYAGVAVLLGAGLIEIAAAGVQQLQAYALPAGVYLWILAWLEWRTPSTPRLKAPFEVGALLAVLGPPLIQALGVAADGVGRNPYAIELMLAGVVILGLGAVLHWWRSLVVGAVAVAAAVLILLIEPLQAVDTWYLVASLGLLMIGGVILLERRRQQIPVWVDGWRERLETWV